MKSVMIASLSAALAMSATPAKATPDAPSQTADAIGQPASDTDFPRCDGYAAPKGKSDGIARETFLLGALSRSADIRRTDMWSVGELGLAACDRALADPRLIDDFWLRRANMLQAKALHLLAAGQPEQAMTLAQDSDTLGSAHDDRYFVQSIGIGNQAVRIWALMAMTREAEARAAIARLRASRPWSQSVQNLASRLDTQLDGSFATQSKELRNDIPLFPEKAHGLFWMYFLNGDYAEARAIAPAVSFDLPKQRGGWTLRGADQDALNMIKSRASFQGGWAYAEAVAGQTDRARSRLADADAEVDEIMVPPPPRENNRPPRKKDVEDHARRLPHAHAAKDELARWQAAIAFRPKLATLPAEQAQEEFARNRLMTLPILPDVLMSLPQHSAAEKAETEQLLAKLRGEIDAERIRSLIFSVKELMDSLPRPETPRVVPVLKPAGDGSFLNDSGLSRAREQDSDIWTIRYTHLLAPIAAVEELAMLGAAQTAQREGHDSLLLLNRVSIVRTTNVSGLYVGNYEQNSGYEAQLRVRFVNAAALPEDLQGMAWRLIPAQRVIDDLSSRYRQGGLTVAW